MYIKYILIIFSLIICLIFSSPILGYLFTLLALVFTLMNHQMMVIFLFIYYPFRPLFITLNSGLIVVGDVIIITALAVVLWRHRHNWLYQLKPLSFFIYFIAFLLIGSVIALYNNVSILALLVELRTLIVIALLVVVFYLDNWFKLHINQIITCSVITAFTISLHGIIEKLFSRTVLVPLEWKQWELSAINADRVYGTLANPNVLASYLLFVFLLSFLPKFTSFKIKIPFAFMQACIFYTALLTESRGTFLAFSIGLIVYLLMSNHWKLLKGLFISVLLSILLFYIPIELTSNQSQTHAGVTNQTGNTTESAEGQAGGLSFLERFKTMFSDETIQASTEWGRIYIVIKGLEIFKDQPLLGAGFATYGDAATLIYSSPIYDNYQINEGIYSDNQYIHILVSTGIIGTLFMVLFVIRMLMTIIPGLNKYERAILISMTVTLLIGCLFYNLLEDKSFMLYYYSVLGVFISRSRGMSDG